MSGKSKIEESDGQKQEPTAAALTPEEVAQAKKELTKSSFPTVHAERKDTNPKATIRDLSEAGMAAVVQARPRLGQLIAAQGEVSVSDYASGLIRERSGTQVSPRAIEAFRESAAKVVSAEDASKAAEQLKTNPCVNSADHCSLMFHPRRFQGNLVFARGAAKAGLEYAISFSSGLIRMNNSSFPSGVIWQGTPLSIVPEKKAKGAASQQDAFSREDFDKVVDSMPSMMTAGAVFESLPKDFITSLGKNRSSFIDRLRKASKLEGSRGTDAISQLFKSDYCASLSEKDVQAAKAAFESGREFTAKARENYKEHFLSRLEDDFFEHEKLAAQLAQMNNRLWNQRVAEDSEIAKLVQVPIEDFISKLVVADLKDENSLASKILLDSSVRETVIERFEGIQGTWTKDGGGTAFFWSFGSKNKLEGMRYNAEENQLEGPQTTVKLERESLIEALEAGTIAPAIFLTMTSLFTNGMQPSGGYNQMDYAEKMREGLTALATELGMQDERARLASIDTSGFVAGPVVLLTQDEGRPEVRQGSMVDYLMDSEGASAQAKAMMKALSIREATLLALPDLYRATVPKDERVEAVEQLELRDIYAAMHN